MTAAAAQRWATGREHGARWLVRLMIWIATRLGWHVGHALLVPITAWFLVAAGETRRASADYLHRLLGRPARAGERWAHLFAFAATILDRVFLLSGRVAGFGIAIEGMETLLATLGEGRGCVLLGAHFGSFDVLRAAGRAAPVPVRPLMYRANLGATTTALLEALDPTLAASVIEVGCPDTMLRVREALAAGEMVGILADRAPAGERLVMVPFLGAPAAFPAGPFALASLVDAPIILFQGIRLGPRNYLIRFEPFADRLVLRRATREADLRAVVARFAARLEAACRAHPTNWFNFYAFWGEPPATAPARPVARAEKAAMLLAAVALGAAAGEPTPAWLGGVMRGMARLPERRATFHEEKRFAALDRPLVSEGTLEWRAPDTLRKITTAPTPERLVVDGAWLDLTERDQTPRAVSLESAPEIAALVDAVRGVLAGDLPLLARHYAIAAEGGPADWRLVMTPLAPSVRTLVAAIVVSGSGSEVRAIDTRLAGGDEQVMTIGPAP